MGGPIFKEIVLPVLASTGAVKSKDEIRQELKETIDLTLKCKWAIIRMKRMEGLLRGDYVDVSYAKEWLKFPEELQQMIGLLKMGMEEFEILFDNFMDDRYTEIIEMVEHEKKAIGTMMKCDFFPSNPRCLELAVSMKAAWVKLEEALKGHLTSLETSYISI